MYDNDFSRPTYTGRHSAPPASNEPEDDVYVYTDVTAYEPVQDPYRGAPTVYPAQPYPTPAPVQSFGYPPPSRSHKKLVAVLVAAGIVVAAGVTAFATIGRGDDTPKSGYYTAADIEPSLMESTNETLSENDVNETVDDVTCVETSSVREWTCLVEMADTKFTVTVNVAADYQTWVSHSAD